jgi:4'-phosphopantetheinyl transferase
VIDGVHIWRAALDDPGRPGPAGLPSAERERAARFLRERDARRWVASRWALRQVLGEYLGIPPTAVELEVEETGKPRLRGAAGLEFSLSHSEDLALVAVAGRPVGVDIEAIRPGRDLQAIAERVLPGADVQDLRAAAEPEQAAVFYRAWTRYEARLKCCGAGIGGPGPTTPIAVKNLDVAPGHAAAVAVAGSEAGIATRGFECRW